MQGHVRWRLPTSPAACGSHAALWNVPHLPPLASTVHLVLPTWAPTQCCFFPSLNSQLNWTFPRKSASHLHCGASPSSQLLSPGVSQLLLTRLITPSPRNVFLSILLHFREILLYQTPHSRPSVLLSRDYWTKEERIQMRGKVLVALRILGWCESLKASLE